MSIAVMGTFFQAKGSSQTCFFFQQQLLEINQSNCVWPIQTQSVGPGHRGHVSQAEIPTVFCTFFIGYEETASPKSGFEAAIHSNIPTKSIGA